MPSWLKARWKAYLESYDPVVAMAGSTPAGTLFVGAMASAVFLALAYVPALAEASAFTRIGYALLLLWVAVGLTLLAWKHQCRGTVGALATLLDNAFYSAALAFVAMNSQGNVAVALAVVHGLVLILFPGGSYGFSLVLAVTLVLPLGLMLFAFQPELPVVLITVCSTTATLYWCSMTEKRRELMRRQVDLEEALGAADRVADENVQAALTTTLLELGHLLHELSNSQTAISTNLQYVRLRANLDGITARALDDAQKAQREQETLLRSTVADLKSRARVGRAPFSLLDLLQEAALEARQLRVLVGDSDLDFLVDGNPEHLRVVLLNLIRNAEQAGARNVRLEMCLLPSGHAVRLVVSNDGNPIPEERRARLFHSFVDSSKPGGSGLGLYLVRRYVELLGGHVEARADLSHGAEFLIRLPGKVMPSRLLEELEPLRHRSA